MGCVAGRGCGARRRLASTPGRLSGQRPVGEGGGMDCGWVGVGGGPEKPGARLTTVAHHHRLEKTPASGGASRRRRQCGASPPPSLLCPFALDCHHIAAHRAPEGRKAIGSSGPPLKPPPQPHPGPPRHPAQLPGPHPPITPPPIGGWPLSQRGVPPRRDVPHHRPLAAEPARRAGETRSRPAPPVADAADVRGWRTSAPIALPGPLARFSNGIA